MINYQDGHRTQYSRGATGDETMQYRVTASCTVSRWNLFCQPETMHQNDFILSVILAKTLGNDKII